MQGPLEQVETVALRAEEAAVVLEGTPPEVLEARVESENAVSGTRERMTPCT